MINYLCELVKVIFLIMSDTLLLVFLLCLLKIIKIPLINSSTKKIQIIKLFYLIKVRFKICNKMKKREFKLNINKSYFIFYIYKNSLI